MVRAGSAWRKNNWRELKHTMARFLAIFAIVGLGVGFFAGLKLARPAMVNIGREFVEGSNFYDFQMISTLGLTEEDAAYFDGLDGISCAEGAVSADLLTEMDGKQVVFKTHQLLQELNQVQLTGGRIPEAPNECLMDDLFATEKMIGTKLQVLNEDGHLFSQESYTVVGICNTAQYLNVQRGTTTLADGQVKGFLYLPAEGYDSEVFTELYVRLDSGVPAFSQEYKDEMEAWGDRLTDELELRAELRKEQVIQEAQAELDKGWAEYRNGVAEFEQAKADAEEELANAKEELDAAVQQLQDARTELEEGEAALAELKQNPYSNPELSYARYQLDEGWRQLEEGEAQYEQGLREFEVSRAEALPQLEDAKKRLAAARAQLDSGWSEYRAGQTELKESKKQLESLLLATEMPVDQAKAQMEQSQQTLAQRQQELEQLRQDPSAGFLKKMAAAAAVETAEMDLAAKKAAYEAAQGLYDSTIAPLKQQLTDGEQQLAAAYQQLTDGEAQYQSGMEEYNAGLKQLESAERQLQDAAAQIEESRKQLEDGEKELQNGIAAALTEGRTQLDDGWKQLEEGQKQYEDGLKEYEDGKAEAETEFARAEKELADGLEELEDAQMRVDALERPTVYALDRYTNSGYASFENDTKIVDSVARIFPVFFFLVAALVCSSTMTRMVEEQRTQNGTLKALGYSDGQILWRYGAYAGGAALLGGMAGYLLCAWLFPLVIWHAYQMLYHFGPIKLLLDWGLFGVSMFFALLCSVGAACMAAWADMRQMPSQLMRPKAPKAGKRIFLEYLTPLWKRLDFLHKVTARNIFRYKKRMIMMVLGVGGCMSLLIAGLGMRDSISTVAEDQFGSIMLYDYSVNFVKEQSEKDQDTFREKMGDVLTDCVFVGIRAVDAQTDSGLKSVSVMVTSDPGITRLVDLHDGDRPLGYPDENGAFISSRLAELAGVKAGDILEIQLDTKERIELPVTGVFDNYVNHFAFMTAEAYGEIFGETVEYTAALAETGEEDVHAVAARLQKGKGVAAVTVNQDFRDMISDTLVSMDAMIVLVVVCAAALSFVVSYNLCNINITERVREIATIKVLGFYPRETHAYVFRESLVLTVMGTMVGIPLGIWFHGFVLAQVQVDMVSFRARITLLSFALAVVITFAIIGMVNLMLRGKIDRIHMAESLKSVE